MRSNTYPIGTAVACSAILLTASIASAEYSIPWRTMDSGGSRVSAGAFRLQGTLAQPDATITRIATDGTTLTGGFWAAPPPPCTGDLNADNTINTADLVIFLGRFSQSTTPGGTADFNADGTVNTADLVIFLARFGQQCQ